jgi:uncharacterized protein (TIGR02246 family)
MNTRTAAPLDTDTESELLAMAQAQAAAWNRADAVGWGAVFSEAADFVNVRGQAFSGRAAIVEQHERIFAGPFAGSWTQVSIRRLVQLAPGIVVIDSMHEVTGFKFLPAGVTATSDGVLRTCMKYIACGRSQGWQIVSGQNTAVLPGGPKC